MIPSIISKRKIWFSVSAALILASIASVAVFGLRFGIDFTGGSLMEIELQSTIETQELASLLESNGFEGVAVQSSDESGYLVRTKDLSETEHQLALTLIEENYGEVEELRFDSIGPVIGNELRRTAIMGVGLTLLLIALYIAWAFRKVSEPVASWKYGILTIGAAFHDVLITLGAFAILGHYASWEVGTAFVAAILTILGYSINDTVVVFDRTRENLKLRAADTFEETVDLSVRQTFMRSFNTSFTTLLALLAIFIFGGESTRPFALALIIGITAGTYSSIFLASPALVTWEAWQRRR